MTFLLIAAGLVLLAVGGELLVRGAVQLAERLGVSPLLIGLTLVGFGTSTPELVTSLQGALAGSPGIAIGNVVGSNIANILLILGVAALLRPIAVSSSALRRDGVLLIATAVAFLFLGWFWSLDRIAGLLLVAALGFYLVLAWQQERNGGDDHTAAFSRAEAGDALHEGMDLRGTAPARPGLATLLLPLAMAIAGLVVVVFGGRFLVDGSIGLARAFGISETVIGLTIVAVGTSMPELVTSVLAAVRRQSEVALGNVLGSGMYNILGIAGVTGLVAPSPIPAQIANFDTPVMVAVSVLLFVLAVTGMRISRREGALLLAGYVVYVYVIWPK